MPVKAPSYINPSAGGVARTTRHRLSGHISIDTGDAATASTSSRQRANKCFDTGFGGTRHPLVAWRHCSRRYLALMLLDEPTQRFVQNHRSSSANDVAAAFRHFGQPEVYGTVTLGLIATGLLSGKDEVTRAGGRLAGALLVAGGASTGR